MFGNLGLIGSGWDWGYSKDDYCEMICRFSRKWTIWGEIKWSLLHFGSDDNIFEDTLLKKTHQLIWGFPRESADRTSPWSLKSGSGPEKWFRTNWDPGESIMGFLGAWTPEKSEISLSTHHSNLNMEPEGAYTTRNPSSYPYHSPGCCHSAGRHCILPGNCWFTTGQRICCLMSKQCCTSWKQSSNHRSWCFKSYQSMTFFQHGWLKYT